MYSMSRATFLKMLGLGSLAFLSGCAKTGGSETTTTDTGTDINDSSTETVEVLTTPPNPAYAEGKHHIEIEVKDYGTIKAELDADIAPVTVSNFCDLASKGFYDGLTFHRIIDGFMIQGGDPEGNGTGNSDKNVVGEFANNGWEKNNLSHERGVISMARAFDPNSGSCQFFIVQTDSTFLDGDYAAFGKVTEGMEIVDKIAKLPVEDENGTTTKENQPVITTIKVID